MNPIALLVLAVAPAARPAAPSCMETVLPEMRAAASRADSIAVVDGPRREAHAELAERGRGAARSVSSRTTPGRACAARGGSMPARSTYAIAPAAAVTPIIMLLVAVAARSGMPIVRCLTGTFTIPPPTPSSAEMTPANPLRTEARRR